MNLKDYLVPPAPISEQLNVHARNLLVPACALGALLYLGYFILSLLAAPADPFEGQRLVLLVSNLATSLVLAIMAVGAYRNYRYTRRSHACFALALTLALANTLLRIAWFETPAVGLFACLMLCSLLMVHSGWFLVVILLTIFSGLGMFALGRLALADVINYVMVGGLLSVFIYAARIHNLVNLESSRLELARLSSDQAAREQELAKLLEMAPYGALIHQDDKILWANQPAAMLLGESQASDLLGRSPYSTLPEEKREKVKHRFSIGEQQRASRAPELFRVERDGQQVILESSSTPLVFRGQDARAVFLRDVTSQHMREIELDASRQAAENFSEAKSRFLATMSHELRTPLNAIVGFTDLLSNNYADQLSEEQRERYLYLINRNSRYLMNLIDDLMEIGVIDSGLLELTLQRSNLAQFVNDCVDDIKPLLRDKDIQLKVDVSADIHIRLDNSRMTQVLLNVLTNAIRHSPAQSSIDIIADRNEEGGIRLIIRDQGEGFSADQRERVFSEFHRQSKRSEDSISSGLGLAVSRRIIEYHGGTISIQNNETSGASIEITLPAPLART